MQTKRLKLLKDLKGITSKSICNEVAIPKQKQSINFVALRPPYSNHKNQLLS